MGRATTTTLAQLGIHVLGVGRHAERDGVGAEPSARSPRRCRRRGDPRHGPPFPATAWAEGAQVHVPPSSRAGCGAWQRGEARARDHAEHDAPHAPSCAVAPSPCDPARDRVDSALTRRATGGAHGPRAPVLARLVQEGTR